MVVPAHFAYILFVMVGGLLMRRWRRAPWVHLPAAKWGAFVELTGRVCPLTPLEHWLRRSAGGGDCVGAFVEFDSGEADSFLFYVMPFGGGVAKAALGPKVRRPRPGGEWAARKATHQPLSGIGSGSFVRAHARSDN